MTHPMFRKLPHEGPRPQLRSHYGSFKLSVDRDLYFDNDTLIGSLKCEMTKILPCKVIIARLRCVLKREGKKVVYPTMTLYRANRILTTRCTLQPVGARHDLDCDGTYNFDFSFSIDSGYPNSMLYEIFRPHSKVLVEWYIAVLCKSTSNEQILLAKTKIVKGAMYVHQKELQPKSCIGKAFAIDRIFQKNDSRMYLYVTLDKNVFSVGEPIVVNIRVVNESKHASVIRICAKAKQIFQNTIGCDAIISESPTLDEADVKGTANHESVFVLHLKPKVECNCHKTSNELGFRLCARTAHVPARLAGGAGTLAPSGVCRLWDIALEQQVNYIVTVKVTIQGGKNVKLWVPFTLTNSPASAMSLSSFMQAHLISPTPVVSSPPSYENLDTHSTPMSEHVRSQVENVPKKPQRQRQENSLLHLGSRFLEHSKRCQFQDDTSSQFDGNSIDI